MGLFDNLFGQGSDPNSLGFLSPNTYGLLAAAGALGQAAMPSRMPIPLGAALGSAASALGQGQQEGALNALKAKLVGFQGQQLQNTVAMRNMVLQSPMIRAALGLTGPASTIPGATPPAIPSSPSPLTPLMPPAATPTPAPTAGTATPDLQTGRALLQTPISSVVAAPGAAPQSLGAFVGAADSTGQTGPQLGRSPAAAPQPSSGLLSSIANPAAAPSAPGNGLADPNNVVAMGMLGDLAGIPSVGTLLSGSPAYQAEIARMKALATNPLDVQKEVDIARGKLPFDIQKEQAGPQMRGEQNRLTSAFDIANKPIEVPGVGFVQPGAMPGFQLRNAAALGAAATAPSPLATNPASAAPGTNTTSQPGVVAPVQTPAQKQFLDSNLAQTDQRLKDYHTEGRGAIEQVGNAAAITDLLGQVRMGWNGDTVQQGAKILSALGVPDESVKQFTGTNPAAGDELNKLFLQFSAGAVRSMGAREPGSVISLFAKAFPNLETQPEAAQLMTNALRMQAQWKTDRANAADAWALNQQQNAGAFGENYKGMLGFEDQFAKTNNPRDYWRAAAAMSNNPDIAWGGLSKPDKDRVISLLPPGAAFRWTDGKLYPSPNQGPK